MQYNFDEKEINKLKDQANSLQEKIEKEVIDQKYKQASDLKAEKAKLEEKVINIKKKFSIPKSRRTNIRPVDIQKVLSNAT